MNRTFRTLIKTVIAILLITVCLLLSFLLYTSISDFQPLKIVPLTADQYVASQIENDTTFTIVSWNMGYSGLGKEMDFFYDGGKKVRASQQMNTKYLRENLMFLENLKFVDFWFFQEIDTHSKRTYFVDQQKQITKHLTAYNTVFSKNYDVSWVPVPIFNPLGKVRAGMMSLSKFAPIETTRYAFPNIAPWPNNLFLLDRCFILSRFLLPNNKQLVLINTHNSYYISNDSLRKLELDIVHQKMIEEFQKGNYVIAGGDWNRLPANYSRLFKGNMKQLQQDMPVFDQYFLSENWNWAFDTIEFTNRELNMPYMSDSSKKSTIDYFIVSPNVKVIENFVYPLNFENSDHNPVFMKFKLKNIILQQTNLP